MFDFLSSKFSSIFSRLSKKGTLTEDAMKDTLDHVRQALLEADVPYDVVESFVISVKQELVGKKIHTSLKPAEHVARVVHDQLVAFLGGEQTHTFAFQISSVVMVMGLQGSGKTTTVGKMAQWIKKEAKKRKKSRTILVASVDFYRPAAVDQLEVLARQVDSVFYRAQSTQPVDAAQEIFNYFKQNHFDVLFLDTAGRLHVDNHMLQELQYIDKILLPKHKFLVLDAMTGQESLNVAKAFDKQVGFDAAVLTKMDSDTRGGAAFSFRYALKKPIVFVGEGEKIDDLRLFYPERAADRMLGMGDVRTLAEKADEKIKQSDQERMYKSFVSGRLTLQDFADQMGMISKIGSLSQISKLIPGMGDMKISQQMLDQKEVEFKKFRAIINSMTLKERLDVRLLNGSRKKRIACGSGVVISDVNVMLKRFEQAQQYAKLFKRLGHFKGQF